jgi:nucleotide-binding universal stress UspA family protein
MTRKPVVIAGVDGSESSAKAVDWAAQHARLMGYDLMLVSVWTPYSESIFGTPAAGLGVAVSGFDPEQQAARLLREASSRVDATGIDVTEKAVEGYPGRSLVEQASEDDTLVVGSEGRAAIGGMLGSTSYYCLRHAPCTVVTIR